MPSGFDPAVGDRRTIPRVLPRLPDLFAVCAPIGGLVGAAVGWCSRASTKRELLKKTLDAAQVGALIGSAVALLIWIGGTAGGA
jgi:H+/Cl- antiporter ClcA